VVVAQELMRLQVTILLKNLSVCINRKGVDPA
jgi:hypothetical protein